MNGRHARIVVSAASRKSRFQVQSISFQGLSSRATGILGLAVEIHIGRGEDTRMIHGDATQHAPTKVRWSIDRRTDTSMFFAVLTGKRRTLVCMGTPEADFFGLLDRRYAAVQVKVTVREPTTQLIDSWIVQGRN